MIGWQSVSYEFSCTFCNVYETHRRVHAYVKMYIAICATHMHMHTSTHLSILCFVISVYGVAICL